MIRKVDPEIARLRGRLGVLTREGNHEEAAEVRVMLDAARKRVALRNATVDLPPLDRAFAEDQIAHIRLAVCDA
jgi:hypothetical protein